MSDNRIAVLFDIDGTLLTTGGAGAASWRLAFNGSTTSQPTSVSSPMLA